MIKKENLIIIFSSDSIDTYVNVICYAYLELGIKNIYPLHISGFSNGIKADRADRLKNDIQKRIVSLSEKDSIYSKIDQFVTIRDVKKIQEEDVDNYLTTEVTKLGIIGKYLIDITPATKSVSQIILASSLINESRNIYEFYLSKKEGSKDEKLYHNLNSDDFRYIHVSDKKVLRKIYSRLTKQKFVNLFAMSISITVVLISIIVNLSILTSIASIATIIACLLQFFAFLHKPD